MTQPNVIGQRIKTVHRTRGSAKKGAKYHISEIELDNGVILRPISSNLNFKIEQWQKDNDGFRYRTQGFGEFKIPRNQDETFTAISLAEENKLVTAVRRAGEKFQNYLADFLNVELTTEK